MKKAPKDIVLNCSVKHQDGGDQIYRLNGFVYWDHGSLRCIVRPMGTTADGNMKKQEEHDIQQLTYAGPPGEQYKDAAKKFKDPIPFGSIVKSKVDGFKGTIKGRVDFQDGCRHYIVYSQRLHEGKPIEPAHIHESDIEIVQRAAEREIPLTGGPTEPACYPSAL